MKLSYSQYREGTSTSSQFLQLKEERTQDKQKSINFCFQLATSGHTVSGRAKKSYCWQLEYILEKLQAVTLLMEPSSFCCLKMLVQKFLENILCLCWCRCWILMVSIKDITEWTRSIKTWTDFIWSQIRKVNPAHLLFDLSHSIWIRKIDCSFILTCMHTQAKKATSSTVTPFKTLLNKSKPNSSHDFSP